MLDTELTPKLYVDVVCQELCDLIEREGLQGTATDNAVCDYMTGVEMALATLTKRVAALKPYLEEIDALAPFTLQRVRARAEGRSVAPAPGWTSAKRVLRDVRGLPAGR